MHLALADTVAAVHLLFVLYVIFAQLAIIVGVFARWSWVRNPWFRVSHLLMIGIVALESMIDFECPLTTWENALRRAAGQESSEGTFIGRLIDGILFFDHATYYHILNMIYISFALLVLGTFWLAPPRFR